MTKGGGGGGGRGGARRGGGGRGGYRRGDIGRIQGQLREQRARARDVSNSNRQRAGARRRVRTLQDRLAAARAARA